MFSLASVNNTTVYQNNTMKSTLLYRVTSNMRKFVTANDSTEYKTAWRSDRPGRRHAATYFRFRNCGLASNFKCFGGANKPKWERTLVLVFMIIVLSFASIGKTYSYFSCPTSLINIKFSVETTNQND